MHTEIVFYTVTEACRILRVSRSTFYALLSKGVLQSSKLGGRTLIAKSEIDRVIAGLTPNAA